MVKNKLLIIYIFCCMLPGLAHGQDIAELKKEFNSIKKDPEYIYGQSSGESEDKCYEIAYEEFLAKLKEYISENDELNNASAVILQNMQKSARKISFERYLNCKVVCVYINKNDIKGVSSSNVIETSNGNVPIIVENINANKDEADKDTVSDSPHTVIESIQATDNNEVKEASSITSEKATINVGGAKENEILNEVANLSDFSKIIAYLNNRKASTHDVVFKTTIQYGSVVNSYWLIFDRNKKLIAIQSKDKLTDLLKNKSSNSQEYSNNPKVWLQIY